MPDETTNVEYKFTGDITSLRSATMGAIDLLDQYQKKINDLTRTKTGKLSRSKDVQNMRSTIEGVSLAVSKLQDKLKGVFDAKLFKGSAEAKNLQSAVESIQTSFTSLQSKSKLSSKEIKELISILNAAKNSFNSLGPAVDSAVEREKRFQETVTSVKQKTSEMSNSMRSSIESILKPFEQVSSKITSFGAKATSALNRLKKTSESTGNGIKKLSSDSEDVGDAGEKLSSVTSLLSPKLSKIAAVFKILNSISNKTSRALSKTRKSFSEVSGTISSATSKISSFTNALKALVQLTIGVVIGSAFGDATKKSIAFIENLNLFTVAMGDSIDVAQTFIDRMAEIYGMDPSNLYRYAGYFHQLSDAIGMTSSAAKTISLSLTKASNDIASLFNIEIEQVVNNLASGMQGLSMAVRKYGIDIRQATIAQTALTYGFTENVATTSEANRQALRYLTIMQQVKNATKQVTTTVDGANTVMGDFARNIETPANQLRILKEQASQVARAFGNFFIPIMEKTLYVVNGVLMAIKLLLQFLVSLAGIDITLFGGEVSKGADDVADSVSGIGNAADKTAKKLRNLIAPFDELTILTEPQEPTSSSAGGFGTDVLDPKLAEAIESMSLELDEIRMKALDIRDRILELLGLSFDGSEITVTIGGFIDDLIHLWDNADYTGFGARIAKFFNQGIQWGIEHTDPTKYSNLINQKVAIIAQILNGFIADFNWRGLGTIIGNGFTIALGALNTFLTTFNFAQLGSSLSDGLNGIIYAVNWDLLGETLGNLFMAKVRTITGFFEGFDWPTLGANLGKGLMSLLNTINWEELGHQFAVKWNGIANAIIEFWKSYDWGTFGSKLAQFFSTAAKELNWTNLGKAFSDTLRGLLRELTTFLGELDWVSVGKAITEFLGGIDWFGLLTDLLTLIITILGAASRAKMGAILGSFKLIAHWVVEGFKNGIIDGFKGIGSWLKEHLVDPVIRSVKGFFGIASPSTVFKEIGGFLISGFLNGITEKLGNIAAWIQSRITTPVKAAVESGLGIVGSVSTKFQVFGTTVANSLMSGLNTVKSKLTTWGSEIKKSIDSAMSSAISKANNALKQIESKSVAVSNAVKDAVQKATDTATGTTRVVTGTNNTSTKKPDVSSTPVTNYRDKLNDIRKMATGGVVRGPTHAIIGEGIYDEAVIPLGNSPELQEVIDRIASAVSATPRTSDHDVPIELHVYLDSQEITSHQNSTNRMYGRTQQNI